MDPIDDPDEIWRRHLSELFRTLKSLAISNMEYFQDGRQSYHARFHVAFCLLYEHIDLGIEPLSLDLLGRVSAFDYSPTIRANGYRSTIKIIEKACLHILQLVRHITVNKESIFFRSASYCKDFEAYISMLGQLRACMYYSQKILSFSKDGNLFAEEGRMTEPLAERLMMEFELLKQECFYGRCLGFQFCESMQRPLTVVSIAMASFSEGYRELSGVMQLASALVSSGKYLINPELRAQQVVSVTRTADISFCKAFWSITEKDIMQQLPSLVCPSVRVNKLIELSDDVIELPVEGAGDGRTVTIHCACAHSGPAPVYARLISYEPREGQWDGAKSDSLFKSWKRPLPRSPHLLIHCHGGGFVAQSSKSHEVYLRSWAKDLGVPILSIDYSLSPENPFPRALEECLFAYAWAVKNCLQLGSTGEKICLAGDSAGGNLLISMTLRAISLGIRIPDGIMAAYTPVLVLYTPSPSRLLSLMDPLLPVGILSRCLAAYAGISEDRFFEESETIKPTSSKSMSSFDDYSYISGKQTQNKLDSAKVYFHRQTNQISLDTGLGGSEDSLTLLMDQDTGDDDWVLLVNEGETIATEMTNILPEPIILDDKWHGTSVDGWEPDESLSPHESISPPLRGLDGNNTDDIANISPCDNYDVILSASERHSDVKIHGKNCDNNIANINLKLEIENNNEIELADTPSEEYKSVCSEVRSPRWLDSPDQSAFTILESDTNNCSMVAMSNTDCGVGVNDDVYSKSDASLTHDGAVTENHCVKRNSCSGESTWTVINNAIETESSDEQSQLSGSGPSDKCDVLDEEGQSQLSGSGPSDKCDVLDEEGQSQLSGSGPCDKCDVLDEEGQSQLSGSGPIIEVEKQQGHNHTVENTTTNQSTASIKSDSIEVSNCSNPQTNHVGICKVDLVQSLVEVDLHGNTFDSEMRHHLNGINTDMSERDSSSSTGIDEMPQSVAADITSSSHQDSGICDDASHLTASSPEVPKGGNSKTICQCSEWCDSHGAIKEYRTRNPIASSNTDTLQYHDAVEPSTSCESHCCQSHSCYTDLDSIKQSSKLELRGSGLNTTDPSMCNTENKHDELQNENEFYSTGLRCKKLAHFSDSNGCVRSLKKVATTDRSNGANSMEDREACSQSKCRIHTDNQSCDSVTETETVSANALQLSGVESKLFCVGSHDCNDSNSTVLLDAVSSHGESNGSMLRDTVSSHGDSNGAVLRDTVSSHGDSNGTVLRDDSDDAVRSNGDNDRAVLVEDFHVLSNGANLSNCVSLDRRTTTNKLNLALNLSCFQSVPSPDEASPPYQLSCDSVDDSFETIATSSPLPHLPSPRKCQPIPRTVSTPTFRMSTNGNPGRPFNRPVSPPIFAESRNIANSPLQVFRHLPVVRNPYMSPLLASDEMLKKLPPLYIMACHLDPILDDSVTFAKKLRRLGNTVNLHVVDDLPHGFLNFVLVSREAKQASDMCVAYIDALFNTEL